MYGSARMATRPPDHAVGERLIAQADRLHLLLQHLASPGVLVRVPVEDLVQETFVRALQTESLPEGDPDLYRYLVTVARHCVIDAVRALRARKRSAREVPLAYDDWTHCGPRASQLLAETMGPSTRAVRGEEQESMRRAFATLDADHRRVIGLRQFEGLSAADTGERMGRSVTAVHSLYRRALRAWESAMPR